ncbi:alpha-2A adrenergic receptor [Topomyia yanbarensis]|uniref:alpha-2A adrenergic receptor n=1 Tax=Topomyia yanbarensis TaxID=2498891 RepID=UPI00273BD15C|nr:alpha-2A adrenergic receptor [Topomyia yanbarensis]
MAFAISESVFNWLTSTNFTPITLKDLNVSVPDDTVLSYVESALKNLSTEQRTTFTVIVITVLVLAIFGNIITIITNIKREQRHLFRACLLSLALSDILFVTITSVIYISQFNNEYNSIWTLGELTCSFAPYIQTLAILVNSVTLVAIALDRYMAVVQLTKGSYEPSRVFCITCAVLIWGLSAGVSSPMLTLYQIYDIIVLIMDPENPEIITGTFMAKICATDKSKNGYYFGIIFTVIFLPLVLSFIWLNSIIAKEIWVRRHPVDRHAKPKKGASMESSSDRKTTTTNTSSPNAMDRPITTLSQAIFSTPKCTCSNCVDLHVPPKFPAPPPPLVKPTNAKSTRTNINSSPASLSRKQRQLRMFKAIVFIMAVFLVCRLPHWIFLLIKMHGLAATNVYWLLHYSFGIIAMINCVLNPLIYTFLIETIKFTVFLKTICRRLWVEPCRKLNNVQYGKPKGKKNSCTVSTKRTHRDGIFFGD